MPAPALARHHRTRLMDIWRSAGWPCQDGVEIDLLAAGMLERQTSLEGHPLLRVTDAGIAWLAQARRTGKRSESLHDRMALAFARQQLLPAGRVVWRELSLRAALAAQEEPPCAAGDAAPAAPLAAPALPALWDDDAPTPAARRAARLWRVARPDLFSIRHTTVPGYLRPMVHEVKASRADLQSDLRHAAKRSAYQWLCEECYYVFPAGIAAPEEVPAQFGVWLMHGAPGEDGLGARFELVRAARHARCALSFDVWMALCRAAPLTAEAEPAQGRLGAP
ncbi:hypothetical protein [Pulveribacter suum]|uniref:Uncharacterized protein n=1 Tax=Pulveribacter suum TaxID=2116657 RepID=A0A2P1NHR9_9BURK|nr:hypothetical protein [Pulveribacter suum]AVP56596.1 hypothetical protein C7H73_02155 [Pulveribacter suum]